LKGIRVPVFVGAPVSEMFMYDESQRILKVAGLLKVAGYNELLV